LGVGLTTPPCKNIIVRKPEMTQASDGIGIQRREPGTIKELKIEAWWKKALHGNIWGRIIKEAKVHKGL
jgi:hypothetical protein